MIMTVLVAVVAVILFILFICFIAVGIKDDSPTLAFVGFILSILLGVAIVAYVQSDNQAEPVTVETESTKTEIEKNVDDTITDMDKNSEITEKQSATEEIKLGWIIIIMLVVFSPALFVIIPDVIEDIIDFISDLIEVCFPKDKKENGIYEKAMEEILGYSTGSTKNVPPSKSIPMPKQKKEVNINKLGEKDSKIAYIVWAVKFLNDQGKESYTRKLENYYIPEIVQAYEQYQKVKSFNVKEMTTEAKKHYEKIVDLSCKVARAEVKKAAGEIVMDMDCNADVCEDIYKKDGYTSMKEELSDIPKEEKPKKKQEKTLHAKSISRDTMIIWDSDYVFNDDMDKPIW